MAKENRLYKHHTDAEIVVLLEQGYLPAKEDLPQLIRRLKEFIALKKFANAVQQANHLIHDYEV